MTSSSLLKMKTWLLFMLLPTSIALGASQIDTFQFADDVEKEALPGADRRVPLSEVPKHEFKRAVMPPSPKICAKRCIGWWQLKA